MSFNINFKNSIPSLSLGIPYVDLKSSFVRDYGPTTYKYNYLDSLGNQTFKTSWPLLVGVIALIIGIILIVISIKKNDKENEEKEQEQEQTTLKKILLGIGIFILIISVFGFGYGAYLYFGLYLPQYTEWFYNLSEDGKIRLSSIYTIDNLIAQNNSKK